MSSVVRFYLGAMPFAEYVTDGLPLRGEYVRFAPDGPAYLIEAIVCHYDKRGSIPRADVALSEQNPGGIQPFPQITRAPKQFVPIESIEPPPEEIQHAEAVNNKKGRQHRGVDRQSNPDAREEGKGAGDIAPGAGDHPHRG
jgi:hypothetical protein